MQQLNAEQRRAVEHTEGRLLILAGAGSGKTSVLTLRMAHLVGRCGVPGKAMLGLTFTNKAAAEMRHRCKALVGEAGGEITLATFHSFCLQVLRQHIHRLGYTTHFTIYDEQDVLRVANTVARDILGVKGELPSIGSALAAIGRARSRGIAPDAMPADDWHGDFTGKLYGRLMDALRAYNAVDFDNLLLLTVQLFEQHPDVLALYHERFRYIMIDEYQDTNPVQARIASLLAAKHGNLCVVGDDDQSIYGWRGAEVKNILDFGEATVVKLEQNYRSTNTILQAANAVIGNNRDRHGKRLWSDRGQGSKIEIFHCGDEHLEAEMVVYKMDQLRQRERLRWSDCAILYRSNALSRVMEQALLKYAWMRGRDEWVRGVPYQIHGGVEFYERREVKDLLAYLRLVVNPRDEEAILRVINQPRRGIGETSLGKLTDRNRTMKIPLWMLLEEVARGEGLADEMSSQALTGVRDFVEVIHTARQRFQPGDLAESMRWLVGRIDYAQAIRDEVKSDQMREFKQENVDEMINALAQSEEQGIGDFIAGLSLQLERHHDQEDRRGDVVSLMTFHSAKGLEFPACFLIAMEDKIIPHEKSMRETGEAEERRLMYVAMTRAKQWLTLSMARQRQRMGQTERCTPSRFLKEIPPELLEVTKGR